MKVIMIKNTDLLPVTGQRICISFYPAFGKQPGSFVCVSFSYVHPPSGAGLYVYPGQLRSFKDKLVLDLEGREEEEGVDQDLHKDRLCIKGCLQKMHGESGDQTLGCCQAHELAEALSPALVGTENVLAAQVVVDGGGDDPGQDGGPDDAVGGTPEDELRQQPE